MTITLKLNTSPKNNHMPKMQITLLVNSSLINMLLRRRNALTKLKKIKSNNRLPQSTMDERERDRTMNK